MKYLGCIIFSMCCLILNANNLKEEKGLFSLDFDRLDASSVLSLKKMGTDSLPNKINMQDIVNFFKSSENITDLEVVTAYENSEYEYSSISGELLINNDTLQYSINGIGIGRIQFTDRQNALNKGILFFKNTPLELRKKKRKRKIDMYVISYEKDLFDFSIWERWRKSDSILYGYDTDEYKRYKNWNNLLDTDGITKAFSLCKRVEDPSLFSYDYYPLSLEVKGTLILDSRIYYFKMNSGGVFELKLINQTANNLYYVCWDKRGLKYFIEYLSKDPINY